MIAIYVILAIIAMPVLVLWLAWQTIKFVALAIRWLALYGHDYVVALR